MKNWIAVDSITHEVKRRYQAEQPDMSVWIYNLWVHMEVPEGVPLSQAVYDGSTITADPAIEAAETARKWDNMRAERDRRLSICDWTQLADSPLSAAMKTNWRTYRQELRDLPETTSDIDNVTWPEHP